MSVSPDPVLDEIVAMNPDILAVCVVGTDGSVIAGRGATDGALASLGSLLAVVSARAVTELGRGVLVSAVVEGDDGLVVVEPIDDTTVVVAVAHRGAAPGLVVSDVRSAVRSAANARAAS